KYVLALYLGRESTASSFGAAGSVIIIMMWIYYSSLILLFGAEFTQVYARQTGVKILPAKYAVPVTEEQRAEEGTSGGRRTIGRASPTKPGGGPSPGHAYPQPAAFGISPGI